MINYRARLTSASRFTILFFALLASAKADVVYSYTGNTFTGFSGADNAATQTKIRATVDLSSALGDNFNGTVSPVSWQISDGNLTFTNLSSNIAQTSFDFVTDAMGNITGWDVFATQTNSTPGYVRLLTEAGADDSESCGGNNFSSCSPLFGEAFVTYSGNQPAFAPVATPEPNLTMLLLGIAVILVCVSTRFAREGNSGKDAVCDVHGDMAG
jgi:hypothetical protein